MFYKSKAKTGRRATCHSDADSRRSESPLQALLHLSFAHTVPKSIHLILAPAPVWNGRRPVVPPSTRDTVLLGSGSVMEVVPSPIFCIENRHPLGGRSPEEACSSDFRWRPTLGPLRTYEKPSTRR